MKRFILVAAMAMLPIAANAQTISWAGELRIDSVTLECASAPVPPTVGAYAFASVQPAGVGDNGPDSQLVVLGFSNNQHFLAAGAPIIGTNSVSVWNITTRPSVSRFTQKTKAKGVKVVGGTPITAAVETFVLKGTLLEFLKVAGCKITFTLPLVRRQWPS